MTLHFENKLLRRENLGNLRQLQITQNLIDFSSNDYLGLARSPQLASKVRYEWSAHTNGLNGLGSTGSRLLTGNSNYAQDLENKIAIFHEYEAALLFSCGYMANVGLLSTIASCEDIIFFDVSVHASIHDGIILSRAKAFPFKHNDLKHLEKRLKNCSTQGTKFICVESLYSMDGSVAPLVEICSLAKKHKALVIVDEAHAVGVCGPSGKGLVSEQKLNSQVFAQTITFGKALGTYGAAILGSCSLKQALINFATSYIYTTALPFHSLYAIKCSYDLFPDLEQERKHLQKLIQMFCEFYSSSSKTHIQSVPFKGNQAVKQAAQKLASQGFDVRPIMSPTIQKGYERLRICLHSFNTEEELDSLLKIMKDLKNE